MKPTTCPFLGLIDDPETHLAFPSIRNCCQRARPVEPVSLEHQSTYCLCMNYVQCTVLSYSLSIPLPEEFRLSVRSKKRNVIGVVIAAFLLVVLFVVGWWQSSVQARPAFPAPIETGDVLRDEGSSTPISPTTIKVAIPNLISDPRYTPTRLQTLVPTESPPPSETPIYEEIPSLKSTNTETPLLMPTESVCLPPSGWVTYIVQPNDSLFRIGLDFNVSVTELQAANCMGTSVIIYTGQTLYVPNVPTRTTQAIPTQAQTEATSPTTQYETSTLTPSASPPFPSETFTPPPIPTETFTPPPTDTGGG